MARYHIASKRLADLVVSLHHYIPELKRIIGKVDSIRGPGVHNEPESIAIYSTQQAAKPTGAVFKPDLVKVTDPATGGGKYLGYIWEPSSSSTIAVTGNVAESDIGQTGAAVMIINTSEVGIGSHNLTSGVPRIKIFPAHKLVGKTSTSNVPAEHGLPVYFIFGLDVEACT